MWEQDKVDFFNLDSSQMPATAERPKECRGCVNFVAGLACRLRVIDDYEILYRLGDDPHGVTEVLLVRICTTAILPTTSPA